MVFDDLSDIEKFVADNDIEAIEFLRNKSAQQFRYKPPFVRSALMLSSCKLKHLNRLDSLDSDIVILNLEDGVAPSLKPMALHLTGLFLSKIKTISSKTVVRINPLEMGGYKEIEYLNTVLPDAIRIPKVKTPSDVRKASSLIDSRIKIHLSIETKEAWTNLPSLQVNDRVEAFYLGALDLLASLKLPQRIVYPDNPMMQAILSRFLIESSIAGVLPVSFVFQDYKDNETFRMWCEIEKEMGYHAKGCISPTQAVIANTMFSPSKEDISRAKQIIELFESDPKCSGFADEKLGFVDEPIYKDAVNLLNIS